MKRKPHYSKGDQILFQLQLQDVEPLTAEETNRLNKIPKITKNRWEKVIQEYGTIPVDCKKERYSKKGRRQQTHGMNEEIENHLRAITREQADLSIDEIRDELVKRTGITFAPSTISCTLKRLKIKLNTRGSINRKVDETKLMDYFDTVLDMESTTEQLIFVDESAKDKYSARRRKVWTRDGVLQPRVDYEYWRQTAYTFIGAMDVNGFIPEASSIVYRKSDMNDNDEAAGTIDAERFEYYVEHELVPILGIFTLKQKRSLVVLDNAPTHKKDVLRPLIEKVGAKLIFLPPYSPDLNPIEACFHLYKSALKRSCKDKDITTVELAHICAMRSITTQKARSNFERVGIYVKNITKQHNDDMDEESIVILAAAIAAASITMD